LEAIVKLDWTGVPMVLAGSVLLIAFKRLDLLAIIMPLSVLVSYLAAHEQKSQRRKI
jgi:hypothetical protein